MDGLLSDRNKKKKDYQKYRAKAREIFEVHHSGHQPHVMISHTASVQILEDGAYVDAIVWIPKEKLNAGS